MSFLFPFFFIFSLGSACIIRLTYRESLRFYPLFVAALAFPTGFAICSLFVFVSFLISAQWGFMLANTLLAGLSAFLGYSLFHVFKLIRPPLPNFNAFRASWAKKTLAGKILLALCMILFAWTLSRWWGQYTRFVLFTPEGGWDARFLWNFKAYFFFRDPLLWKNMFSYSIDWSHPDYPLLLPAGIAWGWNWLGKEISIWPAATAFSFFSSAVLFIFWYISVRVQTWCGFLAAAFFLTVGSYTFWATNQYADVPLAFYITASCFLLEKAFSRDSSALFGLAGWLAGSACWTKNEGLFFLPLLLIAFALYFYKHLKTRKQTAWAFFAGAAFPLLVTLWLKTQMAPHGDYLNSGRSPAELFQTVFLHWKSTKLILGSFFTFMLHQQTWNYLWVLFFLTLCIIPFRKKISIHVSAAPAVLVLIILAGYAAILHTTPYDLQWQIQTALHRLLLHTGVLALIYAFETCGKCLLSAWGDFFSATAIDGTDKS